MTCVPIEPTNFELGPRDYLNHFIHLMGTLRGGKSRYLPLLMTKVHETLPTLYDTGVPLGLPPPLSMSREFEEIQDDQLHQDDMQSSGSPESPYEKNDVAMNMSIGMAGMLDLDSTSYALTPYSHTSSDHSRSYSPPQHVQPV